MILDTRLIESPNGSIAVADVQPLLVMDKALAPHLRGRLSNALGGMPALLRCQLGSVFMLDCEPHLRRYGVDPILDVLPAIKIEV
jgi:hypothetical protein